ncbi:MAG: hypothetical protein M1838_006259 [Thelocarpon superellum]|nr:MAG: hypothetical protein M1838_006259 [Thelocarpon superellum]
MTAMMDGKAAFRVLSLNDADPRVREYKKRKVHEKTKSGCLPCKAKRVKCDESRPQLGPSIPVADLSSAGSPSVLSAVTVVPFSSPSAKNGTSSMILMQHFQRHWTEIFHMPRIDEIVSLSKSHPLVRNTILAITACHLRHVSPGMVQHRIAEHFQQSLVLQDFQRALDTPLQKLGQSGVDALLLSAALLNILAFALPNAETAGGGDELDTNASWVFSPREDRLGWLALQTGLKYLLKSTAAYLDKTLNFLGPIFLGAERGSWAFGGTSPGLEGVPERWIKIFELDDAGGVCDCETAGSADVFRPPVTVLAMLRELEPVHANIFKNLQFLGKVQRDFRALLYDRDERALWLFGYWLGLMCRFEGMWWSDQRVRRDHKAIGIWLEQLHLPKRPGIEGDMWREMMKELESAPVFDRRI